MSQMLQNHGTCSSQSNNSNSHLLQAPLTSSAKHLYLTIESWINIVCSGFFAPNKLRTDANNLKRVFTTKHACDDHVRGYQQSSVNDFWRASCQKFCE